MLVLFDLAIGFWKRQVLTYQSVLRQEKQSDSKAKKHFALKFLYFWNRKLWVFSPDIRTWLMDILVWSLTYRNNFLSGIWVAWVNVSAKIRNLSWCLRLNYYWDCRFTVFYFTGGLPIIFFYSLQNFQVSNAYFLPYPECWDNDKGLLVTSWKSIHLVFLFCRTPQVFCGFTPSGRSLLITSWEDKTGAWEFLVFISAVAGEIDTDHSSQILF